MTRHQLSKDVKEFIGEYIKSVFQLELLLLLHRTADRWWTVNEVSQELGIETAVATTQLATLAEMGLLVRREERPVHFRYGPQDEALRPIIGRLAIAYPTQRVAIFSLILKKSDNRMRRFAEAFRLIKGED